MISLGRAGMRALSAPGRKHTARVAMRTGTWGMRDKFRFYQKNLEV